MLKIRGALKSNATALVVFGLSAGFINGLLGAGGGIVAVIALRRLLKEKRAEESDIFANSLCIMLPVSALSCLFYGVRGDIVTEGFGAFALPAVLGGIGGGLLLGRLSTGALKKLFGGLVILSGILLIIR